MLVNSEGRVAAPADGRPTCAAQQQYTNKAMGARAASQRLGSPSPSTMVATVALGLVVGLLAGHLVMWHQKVVLLEHMYVTGSHHGKSLRAAHGLHLSGSGAGRYSSHSLPGSWSETTNMLGSGGGGSSSSSSLDSLGSNSSSSNSGGSIDIGTTSSSTTTSSSSSSSSSGPRAQFIRGSGPPSSFLYSTSSTTALTAADARRISAVLKQRAAQLPGNTIHALLTGNGSPYQNMQSRIMYASLKQVRSMPGGASITAFTRIMHRTTDDDLVGEFPTFRAYPLQPECDTWCEFPVKDRPNAVVQWLMAAEQHPEMIQGAWLLLLESDYVWIKPLQLPGSAHDLAVQGYGFEYDYIDPAYPDAAKVMLQMCPECSVQQIPKSGPSPVLLRPHELALVAPDWERYAAWIEGDEHAKNVLGWVREMYAWDVAVHKNGVRLQHQAPPHSVLMSQPPHNFVAGAAAILHYTWGALFFQNGREVWRFDKRDWTAKEHELKVPQFQLPPQPWRPVWKLQDGIPVSKDLHALLTAMLTQMNRVSAGLPALQSRGAG